jgi:hypothetical protein
MNDNGFASPDRVGETGVEQEVDMKLLIAFSVLCLTLSSPAALAGPQQEKMKACSKEAKEKSLKGDERKKFMKGCLSNHAEGGKKK